MMILTMLLPVLFFGIHDLRLAKQESNWLYMILYLVMITIALVLWVLLARNIPLKSPNEYIIELISLFVTPQ